MHETPDYGYASAAHAHTRDYLRPHVDEMLASLKPERVFDLGCGNGSTAAYLSERYEVVGVDASNSQVLNRLDAPIRTFGSMSHRHMTIWRLYTGNSMQW